MKVDYDHVCLTVGDIDRSIAFYDKYFGLKVVRRDQPHSGELVDRMTGVVGGELLACFVSDGRFVLEMVQFTNKRGERTKGLPANEVGSPHIGFSVVDVRETYRVWSADGVKFLNPPVVSPRRGHWSVMMADPDGIAIELREGPAIPPDVMAKAREMALV